MTRDDMREALEQAGWTRLPKRGGQPRRWIDANSEPPGGLSVEEAYRRLVREGLR